MNEFIQAPFTVMVIGKFLGRQLFPIFSATSAMMEMPTPITNKTKALDKSINFSDKFRVALGLLFKHLPTFGVYLRSQ
jgi:hypothetical protein